MLTFLIGVPEKSSKKKDVTKSMEDQVSAIVWQFHQKGYLNVYDIVQL